MIEAGSSPDAVAEALDVGRSSVFRWWQDYRLRGVDALRKKRTHGRDAKLERRVARQDLGYPGGGMQTYVLDPDRDLLEP